MVASSAAQAQQPGQPDLGALKARQHGAWSSGDYAIVGTTLQIVGDIEGGFEMFRSRLIGPKATVGRSRCGTKTEGIDSRAATNTACRFSVCDGVSP